MGRIVSNVFIALDGMIRAPFTWQGSPGDDAVGEVMVADMAKQQALLLGRRCYDEWSQYWPHQGADVPVAAHINSLPKYVVTHRPIDEGLWDHSTAITEDHVAAVQRAKDATDGDIGVSGSATTVRWLLENDLLDELHLMVDRTAGSEEAASDETHDSAPRLDDSRSPGRTGTHLRELLGEEIFAENLFFLQAAVDGREPPSGRARVHRGERSRETRAPGVTDAVKKDACGIFALVTDVSRAGERPLVVDDSPGGARQGHWSLAIDTGEITWSVEMYPLFGVDPATFRPELDSVVSLVLEEDREYVRIIVERARARGDAYTARYRIRRPDGAVREVDTHGRPAVDSAGHVNRIDGTLQDVTHAVTTARELARMNAQLTQVNRLNADVTSMLGHDVRGPLGVVLGYLEQLDESWDESTPKERRRFVRTARRSATRLRGLIDDILTLATVDAGMIRPRLGEVGLRALVREVLDEVMDGSEFDATFATQDPVAYADPFHVRQILTNLVSNALRYGAAPFVVHVAEGRGVVEISVSDGGPGVNPEVIPHLFERLAGNAAAPALGPGRSTGFGLYMASRLARTNHGALTYTPPSGDRAPEFTLVLPVPGHPHPRA